MTLEVDVMSRGGWWCCVKRFRRLRGEGWRSIWFEGSLAASRVFLPRSSQPLRRVLVY